MRKILAFLVLIATFTMSSCSKGGDLADVESISFTAAPAGVMAIPIGHSTMIIYSITPLEAMKTAVVEWSSSDESIVSVNRGLATAHRLGNATITASCGNVSAKLRIDVVAVPVTNFTIPESVTLKADETIIIPVSDIQPSDASAASIEWSIEPADVAALSVEMGQVTITGLKGGYATLTGVGAECQKSCEIEVQSTDVAKIELATDSENFYTGYTVNVTATVKPDIALDKSLTWTASSSGSFTAAVVKLTPSADTHSVAVECLGWGNLILTATASNGVSASLERTVGSSEVKKIELKANETSLSVGESTYINATILPDYALNKSLAWKAPSEYIKLDIIERGRVKITALKEGTTTITASANNNVSGSVSITINPPTVTSLTMSQTAEHLSSNGSYGYTNRTSQLSLQATTEQQTTKFEVTDMSNVTFKSLDTSIATVSSSGVVTAVGHGVVYITATYYNMTVSQKFYCYKASSASPKLITCYIDEHDEWTADELAKVKAFNIAVPNALGYVFAIDNGAFYLKSDGVTYGYDPNFTVRYSIIPNNTNQFSDWSTAINSGTQKSHYFKDTYYPYSETYYQVLMKVTDKYTETVYSRNIKYCLAGVVFKSSSGATRILPVNYGDDTTIPSGNAFNANALNNWIYMYLTPSLTDEIALNEDYRVLPKAGTWASQETYKDKPYFSCSGAAISLWSARNGKLTIRSESHPDVTFYLQVSL